MKIGERTNRMCYSKLFFIKEELHWSPRGFYLIATGGAGTVYSKRTGPNTLGSGCWKIRLTHELAKRWLSGELFHQMVVNDDEVACKAFRMAKPYRGPRSRSPGVA